jgi:predicted short-subunit dehydrogenase-like oxidoreductase (DUF2520 family)
MIGDQRPRIGVIGVGRAGGALGRALYAAGYSVVSVWSRSPERATVLAREIGAQYAEAPSDVILTADLTILAVTDQHIQPLAAALATAIPRQDRNIRMLVHLSGVNGATILQSLADVGVLTGAFHPLQTFADERSPVLAGTHFGIEASEPLRTILRTIATVLGGRPLDLDPNDRALYHAAATMTSNYTISLIAQAVELMQLAGFSAEQSLDALLPLLRGTVENLDRRGLPQALTGPIVRGDITTVQYHLNALSERAPDIRSIYRALGAAALPLATIQGLDPERLQALKRLLVPQGDTLEY